MRPARLRLTVVGLGTALFSFVGGAPAGLAAVPDIPPAGVGQAPAGPAAEVTDGVVPDGALHPSPA